MSEMPATVTATYTKTVTYDIKEIIATHEALGKTGLDREEVFDYIYECATEDLGCGYGHFINLDDIEFSVKENDDTP